MLDLDDIATIRKLFREELSNELREKVPLMLRPISNQISNMQLDVNYLKNIVRENSKAIKRLENVANEHSMTLAEHTSELTRLGGLYEYLEDKFKADGELLKRNLNVKDQVRDHDYRLMNVETDQKLLKKVVTEHSRLLKPKAA
jgi:hypothetical protein